MKIEESAKKINKKWSKKNLHLKEKHPKVERKQESFIRANEIVSL